MNSELSDSNFQTEQKGHSLAEKRQETFGMENKSREKNMYQQSSLHNGQELHTTQLSMQMKSGGNFSSRDDDVQLGYVGSLRPTTTGSIIRSESSALYTQAYTHHNKNEEKHFPEIELRKIHESGSSDFHHSELFSSQSNPQLSRFEDDNYGKLSVQNLVTHFSKYRKFQGEQSLQYNPPTLASLREEAKSRQYQFQEKNQVLESVVDQNQENLKYQELLSKRRNSLKNYLHIESGCESNSIELSHLEDPSAILKGGRKHFRGQSLPHYTIRSQSSSPSFHKVTNVYSKNLNKPFRSLLPDNLSSLSIINPDLIQPSQPVVFNRSSSSLVEPRVFDLSSQCIQNEITEQNMHNQSSEYLMDYGTQSMRQEKTLNPKTQSSALNDSEIESKATNFHPSFSSLDTKQTIEQMIEELNRPLPPMQPIPSDLLKDFQPTTCGFNDISSLHTSQQQSGCSPLPFSKWQLMARGSRNQNLEQQEKSSFQSLSVSF